MTTEISFGSWLRQRRRMLDLTQLACANLVGCSRSTLRRIEAGDLKPSKELALIFLEKLGIPNSERSEWVRFARGLSAIPQKSTLEFVPIRRSTNLPVTLTTFIGRENEQAQIISLIAKYRLVTLIGPGGVGKTRLALQACQKLMDNYPGGIWFVALDSLSDPALVPQAVASTFNIQERSDHPIIETLIDSLREKTALLILDNCEHLLGVCAHLAMSLLTNCPNLRILATSRETLGVEGGVTYPTPSLSIPASRESEPARELSKYESVKLFIERATLTIPSFSLTNEETKSIVNICRRLDGIPLAIELAAARVDILQVDEILEQLNHCFDLLVSNSRTVLPRHQTMHASMDWSWGLLTKSEQTFMRQLAVFAGGWALEAAQVVCEGSALNLTSALVKKSLIIVNQESRRETHYGFHEIVRQYGRDKLIEAGEEADVRTRHVKYFVKFCEQAESALRGPAQMEWYARLNDERDNIRAALEWADQTDVEAGLYICGRLRQFWEKFDLQEGTRWLNRFVQKPESAIYPHAKATALCSLAWSLQWLEDFDQAHIVAQECLDLYRACGNKYGEVDALTLLGAISSWHVVSDMELLQQALRQAKSLRDGWSQASILGWMGHLVGTSARRVFYWEKAISLYRKAGDFYMTAGFLAQLADYEMECGNFDSARLRWEAALLLNQQKSLGAERNPYFLAIYGRISSNNGDYKKARSSIQAAVTIAEEQGHRMNALWMRTALGYLALREGNISEAQDLFVETTRNFQKDQNIAGVTFTLAGMATLYVAKDKPDIAVRLIGWADATREKNGDKRPPLEQADVDQIITDCLAKLGEVAFSDAYDEGQAMTLDEAVTYALKES
jgi:predicted ATPase/DNA-binding XRE family transcriptional regulator